MRQRLLGCYWLFWFVIIALVLYAILVSAGDYSDNKHQYCRVDDHGNLSLDNCIAVTKEGQ